MLPALLVDERETAVVQQERVSVCRLCMRRLLLCVALTNSDAASRALTMPDYSMLVIGATLAIGAMILLRVLRRRKSNGLEYLGAVSPRWIAEERAASHDGLRSTE
jgi:hypothetical protein